MTHPLNVTFFMRGGHKIEAVGVKEITMGKNNATGNFDSYTIEWYEHFRPPFFSLALDHILGVTAVHDTQYDFDVDDFDVDD